MNVIVPLAGPDFVHPKLGIKPLMEIDGEPLVRRAVTSRAWWRQGITRAADLVFVLRVTPEAEQVATLLEAWFPGCRVVRLSDLTMGAALSALAGAAMLVQPWRSLCIDLVDLLFESDDTLADHFADPAVGAAATVFPSDEACYSYLEIGDDGMVIRAVEKRVISEYASAGTYAFRDVATYLDGLAHSLRHADEMAVNGSLFVCPTLNGVIAAGSRVVPVPVGEVLPVSRRFHQSQP